MSPPSAHVLKPGCLQSGPGGRSGVGPGKGGELNQNLVIGDGAGRALFLFICCQVPLSGSNV